MPYRCLDSCVQFQEPALWALTGTAVVTRFGAILSDGRDVILDPGQHGVCHRMRTPDDLSPRTGFGAKPEELLDQSAVREVFVISQPWGHTVFHFIVECLPKVFASHVPVRSCLVLHTPMYKSSWVTAGISCRCIASSHARCMKCLAISWLASSLFLINPESVRCTGCGGIARARTGWGHPGSRPPID